MYFARFDETGYDSRYLDLRKEIDVLCDAIVAQEINTQLAMKVYQRMELEYSRFNLEGTEFFRMMYKNRIERLCRQFSPEAEHAH